MKQYRSLIQAKPDVVLGNLAISEQVEQELQGTGGLNIFVPSKQESWRMQSYNPREKLAKDDELQPLFTNKFEVQFVKFAQESHVSVLPAVMSRLTRFVLGKTI